MYNYRSYLPTIIDNQQIQALSDEDLVEGNGNVWEDKDKRNFQRKKETIS